MARPLRFVMAFLSLSPLVAGCMILEPGATSPPRHAGSARTVSEPIMPQPAPPPPPPEPAAPHDHPVAAPLPADVPPGQVRREEVHERNAERKAAHDEEKAWKQEHKAEEKALKQEHKAEEKAWKQERKESKEHGKGKDKRR